jgi:hypothetical protein
MDFKFCRFFALALQITPLATALNAAALHTVTIRVSYTGTPVTIAVRACFALLKVLNKLLDLNLLSLCLSLCLAADNSCCSVEGVGVGKGTAGAHSFVSSRQQQQQQQQPLFLLRALRGESFIAFESIDRREEAQAAVGI